MLCGHLQLHGPGVQVVVLVSSQRGSRTTGARIGTCPTEAAAGWCVVQDSRLKATLTLWFDPTCLLHNPGSGLNPCVEGQLDSVSCRPAVQRHKVLFYWM
jgi:hypothetical protein